MKMGKKMNREKIADWITKMCCQHLWAHGRKQTAGKVENCACRRWSDRSRIEGGVKNKRTRRRKCAGRDGIIAWKAKRIWLTVGMIMTNGSCWISWKCTTSSMSGKKINSFLVYDKESNGWLVCESRCESPQNDEQAIDCRPIIVHQRFAVCIDFNINSIWFCLRNVFFLSSFAAFENESKYYANESTTMESRETRRVEGQEKQMCSLIIINATIRQCLCKESREERKKNNTKKEHATRCSCVCVPSVCNHKQRANERCFAIIIFHQIPSRVPNFNSIYLLGNVCECY